MLLFEPDLLFSSRIEGAGHRFGLDVKVATTLSELEAAVKGAVPGVVVVNLDTSGLDYKPLLGLIQGKCRLVGYFSHVDSKLAVDALASGFELVIPRRTFLDRLGEVFADIGSS